MSTQVTDLLSEYVFPLQCSRDCGREATFYAKGCMDKEPVALCNDCLKRGLDVVRKFVNLYQRTNKRVLVCGDCFRPVLSLETHLDLKPI